MPEDEFIEHPPRKPLGSIWIPGMVDIEFHQGVWPKVVPKKDGQGPIIESMKFKSIFKKGEPEFDLSNINSFLTTHVPLKLYRAIEISRSESLRLQGLAIKKNPNVSNLAHFIVAEFENDKIVDNLIVRLRNDRSIRKVNRVALLHPPNQNPEDPRLGISETDLNNQWYVYRCHVDEAWKKASGRNVVIADIDWGFNTEHEDLKNRIDSDHSKNFLDDPPTTGRESVNKLIQEHGNGVLGYCGAERNKLGIRGIAYNACLWPVIGGNGQSQHWADAIYWVTRTRYRKKPRVLILEVEVAGGGFVEMRSLINTAVACAVSAGIVVCVCAGNGGHEVGLITEDQTVNGRNPTNPTEIPDSGSIVVGATKYPWEGDLDKREEDSNFGNRVNIYAPGDQPRDVTCGGVSDVYSAGLGGTSSATAKVAGIAALMLEVNPFLTSEKIRKILNETGAKLKPEAGKALGPIVNAKAAVKEAENALTFMMKINRKILRFYWWIVD